MAIQIRQPGAVSAPTIQTSQQGVSAAKQALTELSDPARKEALRRKALEDIAAQQNIAQQQFDQQARQTGAARGGITQVRPTGALFAQQEASAQAAQQDLESKLAAGKLGLEIAGQEQARSAQQAQLEQQARQFSEEQAQRASEAQAQVGLDERRLAMQEEQFAKQFGLEREKMDFGQQIALREASRADLQAQLAKEEGDRAWEQLSLNKEIANNQNVLALRQLDQQKELFDKSFQQDMAKLRFEAGTERDIIDLNQKYNQINKEFDNQFQLVLAGLKNDYEKDIIKLQGEERRNLETYVDQLKQQSEDRNRGWGFLSSLFGIAAQGAGYAIMKKL